MFSASDKSAPARSIYRVIAEGAKWAFLMRWVVNWLPSVNAGWSREIADSLSSSEHLDVFSGGIVVTTQLSYFISLITVGLFLTAKSVDTERWRG